MKRNLAGYGIIGLNVLIVTAYTGVILWLHRNPGRALLAVEGICLTLHFAISVALWLEKEKDYYLIGGILVLIVGVGACYSLPQAFLH